MASPYTIAIALQMSSNHNQVLAALSSGLLGVNANVSQLTSNFGRLKTAIGGALAITAGVKLIETMAGLIDRTKEYSAELVKIQNLGGGVAAAVRDGSFQNRAFSVAQATGMNVTDVMKISGQTNSLLGYEDGDKVLDPLAKFAWVMQNQKDFKGNATDELGTLLRAGELGGRLSDPTTRKAATDELIKFLDLSQKVMAATHGMVNPQTMLGMTQQAGFSMRGMTDEGFMNMAIMAQAMGGPRAGTAMLSLYNQVGTGKMTGPAAKGLEDLGMLGKDEYNIERGGKVFVKPEALQRMGKMLGTNPMEFVEEIYKNLEAKGITDPDEQKRRVATAMSRQTSERFVIDMMMNMEQMKAEIERMKQGAGSGDAFANFNAGSIEANEAALKNAWINLQMAVTGPQSANVIALLQSLTGGINSMTSAVRAMDPNTLKDIGIGLGVLAGALIGGGVVALAAALGPVGWIAAGVIALGAAVAKFGPDVFKAVVSGLDAIGNALKSFVASLGAIAGKVMGLFGGGTGPVTPQDKAFKENLDGANKAYTPMSFHPGNPPTQKAQPISLQLNVNGRTLAESISDELVQLMNFPTGAPAADGNARWHDGDHNLSST